MNRKKSDVDYSWLDQLETEGPFLSLPVVKSVWPTGVDRLGDTDDRTVIFKQAYADWLRAYDARALDNHDEYVESTNDWVYTVLDKLADWDELRIDGDELHHRWSRSPKPDELEIRSPGEQIRIRPGGALEGRDTDYAVLLRIVEPSDDLRGPGLDGWSATEIDRLAALLRKANVEVGIVTDGRWWAIVWAHHDKPTGSAITDAATWGEEPLVRDAFLTLINQRRFRAKEVDERLPRLLERSELEAEEITEALGTQVRKAVELLVGSFSRARLEARAAGEGDPLPEKDDDVYQAAVTVLMRVVFLLFAEERGMLPTEKLYWDSYAIRDVLDVLQKRAAHGEELLDETYDTWHRLLAVSDGLHGGVNYDEMRMPAYGGSLLDPGRFPWLSVTDERGLLIKVRDRVMLHVLKSVQYVNIGKEARRISFRDIDVEQIGYIYEGLLGYTCTTVEDDIVLGLEGKDGEEPEIDASALQQLYVDSADGKSFANALRDWAKQSQPSAKPATVPRIAKAYDTELTAEQRAEAVRQLTPIAGGDQELLDFLVDWSPLIRRDLRGVPFVVPVGGLVVTETPSRKHAGAHYTPRSLAEEVVQHALEPLVYEPGPLDDSNRDKWQLKGSTAILDLKVADIAAGSGAFLVAAARFLAERVVEAWTVEGAIAPDEKVQPDRAYERAIREVIARCLYGADINSMAVEMCKLSLWLVSLDPTKPFSFVDDKIFCGNSLLGVTDVEQLRYLHIYPDSKKKNLITELIDIDAKLDEATRLRHELASSVVDHDPMRSRVGKARLLRQVNEATLALRNIADGIVAAGLPLGGKPGKKLDDAYAALSWAISETYPSDGTGGDRTRLDAMIGHGLTPTVDTDYERWQPLHWVIEVPDVLVDRGGFDAIIGNPAFLHSKKVSTAFGVNYRSFLQSVLANGVKGNADLAAYFLLRQMDLVREGGSVGLVVTKSITQSSTRKVGLEQVLRRGVVLDVSDVFDWGSGDASVSVIKLWLMVTAGTAVGSHEPLPPVEPVPEPAFVGTYPNGDGFRISREVAASWLKNESELSEFLWPYVRAADLSSGLPESPSEYIIDVHGLSMEEARKTSTAWEHLREHQLPWRSRPSVKPRLRENWWWYEASADRLYRSLEGLDKCIAIPRTSNLLMPRFVPARMRFDVGVVVFPSNSWSLWGQLASSLHYHWVIRYAATTRNDPSYAPKRISDTFPWVSGEGLNVEKVQEFEAALESDCETYGGLRAVMNEFNGSMGHSPEVGRLRELYIEMDRSILEWFGWSDIDPQYDVRKVRNLMRFTMDEGSAAEILDRLLLINQERAGADGRDRYDEAGLF